jgi:hypothetical protein
MQGDPLAGVFPGNLAHVQLLTVARGRGGRWVVPNLKAPAGKMAGVLLFYAFLRTPAPTRNLSPYKRQRGCSPLREH